MKKANPKKLIKWWDPQIGLEEKKLIEKVLLNNFPNEGQFTELFEKKLASLLGCKYAVAVTSGTAALFLALKALGIKSGDEVIIPDMTFIATANAVQMCGARPVFVDVDPRTMCLDPAALELAINKKTKAVIPVHVSGRNAHIDEVTRIARQHSIKVVEDAAEAFMSRHKGRYLGTFGQAGCFSFSPHKTITTGQGGVVVTDDKKLFFRLRELKDQGRRVRGTGGDDFHKVIGYNFKFTDLQAAVGLGQLTYLKSRIKRMRQIYGHYSRALEGTRGISLLNFNVKGGEIPQWVDVIVDRRDALYAYLKRNNIDCRRFWLPVHTQLPYRMPDAGFPNSTGLSAKAMWLPSAFTMSGPDVDFVCDKIKYFLSADI